MELEKVYFPIFNSGTKILLPKVMMQVPKGSQVLDKEVKTNHQSFSQFN
jgi:hypothetical protein